MVAEEGIRRAGRAGQGLWAGSNGGISGGRGIGQHPLIHAAAADKINKLVPVRKSGIGVIDDVSAGIDRRALYDNNVTGVAGDPAARRTVRVGNRIGAGYGISQAYITGHLSQDVL